MSAKLVRFSVLFATLFISFASALKSQPAVLTMHNDNFRTGQNLNETILTPLNVKSSTFGKVFSYPVDGQVYAQPLYVPSVTIPNKGVHNVVYIATENDSVYAFDGDGVISAPLWQVSFINPAAGITPVNCADNSASCNVYPILGVTATPVIDRAGQTMYVLARTAEKGVFFNRLHALDIRTGAEKFGGPVVIQGSVPGTGFHSKNGIVTFDSKHGIQRTALLLLNGRIYMGWSAGGGHGWVMAYDAQTLQQKALLCLTPNGVGGGIWQSGAGFASDSSGNIFLATGDGTFDANSGGVDYGDSVLKLNANLQVLDYFTPVDQSCRSANDEDLASGGPLLLPPQPGAVPNELVVSGKGGARCDAAGASPIYLVNRDQMGHYSSQQDSDVQTVSGAPYGYWSNPAYFKGPSASYLYYSGTSGEGGSGDFLKQYNLANGLLPTTPSAQTSTVFPVGSTPSISANGTANGILWTIVRNDSLDEQPGATPAVLYALDPTNVGNEFYDSAQAGARDQAGASIKFGIPTITNGRVYVGTQTEVDVYGLLGPSLTLSAPSLQFGNHTVQTSSGQSHITLTNNSAQSLTFGGASVSGPNAADFAVSTTCPANLASSKACAIRAVFTPSAVGRRSATITLTDGAGTSPQTIPLWGIGVAAR